MPSTIKNIFRKNDRKITINKILNRYVYFNVSTILNSTPSEEKNDLGYS